MITFNNRNRSSIKLLCPQQKLPINNIRKLKILQIILIYNKHNKVLKLKIKKISEMILIKLNNMKVKIHVNESFKNSLHYRYGSYFPKLYLVLRTNS